MKVHHVGYLVKNIELAEKSLLALGFEIEQAVRFDDIRKARMSFLVNGAERVELVEPAEDSELRPLLKKYKNSPYHICYITPDLASACASLENEGFVVFKQPEIAPCLGGREVCFLMSPGAGMIELVTEDAL